jgi:hypothetical protein
MDKNPYAPPTYDQPPPPTGQGDDGFIENGRGVSAGRGSAWLTEAWDIVKGNLGSWVLVCILYGILVLAVAVIPKIGQIAISALSPVLYGGLFMGCRDTREGRDFGVGHLFEGFKKASGLLALGGAHVAWLLVVGVVGKILGAGGIFNAPPKFDPSGGLPGLMAQMQPTMTFTGISLLIGIPVTMAFFYAPALVALRDMSPIAALKNSFLGAAKNVLPYIVYVIVLVLFTFAAMIPCFLGLLVLFPVTIASIYVSYRDVFFADDAGA